MQDSPLSASEREELERLRAEKEALDQAQAAAREREELERMRKAVAQQKKDLQTEERIQRAKIEAKNLMEPDDDLHMAKAQKIVFIVVFFVVIASIFLYFLR